MSHRQLRIAIADADSASLDQARHALTNIGHKVISAASTASSLVHGLKEIELIIADINAVSEGDVHAIVALLEGREVPLVVTSSSASDEAIDIANSCRPLAHLVKPLGEPDLKTAISLAIQRFEELRSLQHETCSLRQALADRKLIERAKGIVMHQCSIEEAEAFRHIQRLARERRQALIEVAKNIIAAEPAFRRQQEAPSKP